MAKQHVSFVERHVEKIVLGVAGAILMGVALVYLVGTPHAVALRGQSLGPQAFYGQLDAAAQQTLSRMREARAGDHQEQEDALRQRISGETQPPPLEIAWAPVNLSLPVPEFTKDQMPVGGKAKLAAILPPATPAVTTGRADCELPDPVPVEVRPRGGSREGYKQPFDRSRRDDHHWVAVFFAVSRKAQRAAFMAAGYMPEQVQLLVAGVRAERQEQLPDGRWSAPEPVRQAYDPKPILIEPQVELIRQDNELRVTQESRDYVAASRSELEKSQPDILRPPFQEFLRGSGAAGGDEEYQWLPPEAIEAPDGSTIDMTDEAYRVHFPPEEESSEQDLAWVRKTLKAAKDALGTEADVLAAMDARDDAKTLSLAKDYLKAREQLDAVARAGVTPPSQKQEADKLLTEHKDSLDRIMAEVGRLTSRRTQYVTEGERLGEDVEPGWLTDIGVVPGKTYRYRVRLAVLNQYAGVAHLLETPEDAKWLVREGEWSDWSDPVTVRPDKYLFFTRGQESRNSARVELYQWKNGEWSNGATEVKVGEAVAFRSGRTRIDYGATVAAIEFNRPYQERSPDKGDAFKYKPVTTDVLTLVDAEGHVEERIQAEDKAARGDVKPIIDAERARKDEGRFDERRKEREPERWKEEEWRPPPSRRGSSEFSGS